MGGKNVLVHHEPHELQQAPRNPQVNPNDVGDPAFPKILKEVHAHRLVREGCGKTTRPTFRRFNSARNNESLEATLMAPVRVAFPFQPSQPPRRIMGRG
jgi:hypothetical protein